MPRSSAPPDFADRPPWTRPGFIASAALLLVIVIVGVLIAALSLGDDSNDTADSTPPVNPAPAGSSPDQALPTTVPTTAPDDVTWHLVGQVAVPSSDTAGPRTTSGGVASGYAHTPVGALIAAAQISIRASYSAGRASWEPTIERQLVPSADRDRLLSTLKESDAAGESAAQPGELSQIAGFSYQSYTPDTAVIGLALRAPAGNSRYHIVTLSLLWRDDDWRLVAPPGGAWTSLSRPAPDLTGVVEWGAR
ncbi:hypothetical protein ACFY2R_26490 [Micromonospora olivasterospora]|uniref:DUF8175 domain-containing protein n=1 Tax=Micromonospora olivasterospora TaxID=1880 RepID=A0A562HVI9_MICOL|nr:hypothetical protein [Micromonospora olivasterospora]TWH62333.1 hypothetical protein JD77_06384 [Micromonospora olivasterospora]